MRQRRIHRGALTLASAEVKFQIDTETHDPLDIGMFPKQRVFFFLGLGWVFLCPCYTTKRGSAWSAGMDHVCVNW